MDDFDKRIKEFNDAVLSDEQEEVPGDATEEFAAPVDIYQQRADSRFEESKRVRPNGSSAVVNAAVKAAISGDGVPGAGLAAAHKKAKDDIELLKSKGDVTRAEMARQQYMDEKFIPAIEVVIRYASPDELLNSREALKALDEMAISAGSAKGYTAAYVKSAYGNLLGQNLNGNYDRSDDTVTDAVRRIKMLSEADSIRAAVGVAKQIKKKIDAGENIASEDDYELISRVVSFGD
jgi:hypothetical protein